jgi:hypothetical protein
MLYQKLYKVTKTIAFVSNSRISGNGCCTSECGVGYFGSRQLAKAPKPIAMTKWGDTALRRTMHIADSPI